MPRTHYISELEAVRTRLVQMGETTIELLTEALQIVGDSSRGPSIRASELEAETDRQHRAIHDQCVNLITLQAPVASDARLVTGILDAIVDLESIGDHSYEIVTLSASISRKPPSQILSQIVDSGGKIRDVLALAIDSWRSSDRALALSVRPKETPLRSECESICEKISRLLSTHGEAEAYVDLILVCKHLERILRHAVCVADQGAEAAPLTQVE